VRAKDKHIAHGLHHTRNIHVFIVAAQLDEIRAPAYGFKGLRVYCHIFFKNRVLSFLSWLPGTQEESPPNMEQRSGKTTSEPSRLSKPGSCAKTAVISVTKSVHSFAIPPAQDTNSKSTLL
jgi:hypothetical protein